MNKPAKSVVPAPRKKVEQVYEKKKKTVAFLLGYKPCT